MQNVIFPRSITYLLFYFIRILEQCVKFYCFIRGGPPRGGGMMRGGRGSGPGGGMRGGPPGMRGRGGPPGRGGRGGHFPPGYVYNKFFFNITVLFYFIFLLCNIFYQGSTRTWNVQWSRRWWATTSRNGRSTTRWQQGGWKQWFSR